jgi:putative FmdB family regulatory protein
MPTYDYVCEACGHEFEAFHAMSAPSLRTCPKCGRRRLVRRIGAGAGVIFKGSGFYQTDYKSPPRGEAAKDGAGDGGKATGEGKTEAKGEGKTEAKGEGKAEAKTEAKSGGKTEASGAGKSEGSGGKAAGPHRPRSERGRA